MFRNEDLKRLDHVNLIIARWPCQGHSRAGTGRGLDDPRSSLSTDLMKLTQWKFTHQLTSLGYIFENVS
jgi:site-specific DNA-cytosine methylase